MTISVLITTRNRAKILKQCLKSLVRQSRKPDEVIVVDNASSDNTKEIIKSFKRLNIKYFSEKNIGIAYGRNRGLEETKGEIFSFIDDDCVASKSWLKAIEKTFESDKNIVGIVGRSENMFPKNPYAVAEQCWFLYWYLKHISSRDKEEVLRDGEIIDFKNAVFRLSLFGKTRFDTSLTMGQFSEEDTEIRGRLFRGLELKEKIIYQPKAVVLHQNRSAFSQLLLRRFNKGVSFAQYSKQQNIIDVENNWNWTFISQWVRSIIPEIRGLSNDFDKAICLFVSRYCWLRLIWVH